MTSIWGSVVDATGRRGTYQTTYGSTGLGYEVATQTGSVVVHSGGNGFYYPVENLASFVADNGAGYMRRVRSLALPPAYKR
jgi:hypothetical protein